MLGEILLVDDHHWRTLIARSIGQYLGNLQVVDRGQAASEALMRLRMLDGTMVPPSIFIPIAENTGSIHELGLWAVRQQPAHRQTDKSFLVLFTKKNPSCRFAESPGGGHHDVSGT